MATVDISQVKPDHVLSASEPPKAKTEPPPNFVVGLAKEGYHQARNTLVGALEILDKVGSLTDLSELDQTGEKLRGLGSGVVSAVKAPLRALRGLPQEGQPPESAPPGLFARPFDALDVFIGGDPGKGHILEKKGDTGGAVAAYATGPLLLGGVERLLKGPTAPPPIGPRPLSQVPKLRENIPLETSRTAERVMRTARPGQYLPNKYARVKKLASAIGSSSKIDIPKALSSVLPELDKTAREYGIHPKGLAETEGAIERPGEGVNESETLNSLMSYTMSRLEREYQTILDPIGSSSQIFSTDSIADRIAAQKTQGMIDMAAQNPNSEVAKTVNYLNEAENLFRGKAFNLRTLDDLRKYYYNAAKAGEAGRIAARSNEAVMADSAIEQGLRDKIYSEMESAARAQGKDPGFIRNLKETQRNLYSLLDLGNPTAIETLNKDAIKRGYDLLQRMNVTSAIHPESMHVVGSIHNLKEGLVGSPESLKSSERRVRQAFGEKGVPNTRKGKAASAVARSVPEIVKRGAAGSIPERREQKTELPPAAQKTVKIKTPVSDEPVEVPADQLQHYISLGATVVK